MKGVLAYMILYREGQINFLQQECFGLEFDDSDAMLYVSKGTYSQAILLNDRFEGEISALSSKLEIPAERKSIVKFFYDNAPEPISILAPFLGLVKEEIELHEDMRELCGILHQMSMAIDFDNFVKVPADVRADVSFGKKMLFGYEQAWRELEMKIKVADIDFENVPLDVIKTLIREIVSELGPIQTVTSGVKVVNTYATEEVDDVEESRTEEEEIDDIWAIFDAGMKESAEKHKEENKPVTMTVEIPAAEPEVEETSSTGSSEESEIDKIMKLMGGK